jgi:membrane fusion protein, heavy metal efflux system
MPSMIRNLAARILGMVPTVLTLALLAVLGVWGARNDWKLGSLSSLWTKTGPLENPDPIGVKIVPEEKVPTSGDAKSSSAPRLRIEFPSAEAVRLAGIRVEAVQIRSLARYVTAYGMLDYEPGYYVELSSRAPGTIWRVDKVIGDEVKTGDTLALVDSAEVGQAKADFLKNLSQVEVRKKAVQRLQAAGGSVPEATRQETETGLRAAQIQLFNDQQRLLNFGLTLRIHDVEVLAEEQRVRHLRLLGLPDSVLRDADPETLTANLLPLTAPFKAVVIDRRGVAPGQVVTTKQVLFTLADLHHLHADLDVHPEDMADVRVGQNVTFQPDKDQGPPAKARVAHISPEVNEKSRNVEVHTEVENPNGRLRPHTFGTGRILIEERPRAVTVPTEAIQSDGRAHLVFVRLSPASFQVRPVRPGLREGAFTEVDGVQPGEEIATIGSYLLKSELLKEKIGAGEE